MSTPMMEQYQHAKKQHRDALLFFRMGDFYEMFFEDAETASRVLGLTLTSREKGTNAIPMAGIPHRNLDTYLSKLIRAGHKVAICDQVQDPKEATGIVERRVTRVVTPGTLTEDSILEGKEPNFLAAVTFAKGKIGLACVDLSTGRFLVAEHPVERLGDELARITPAECLVPEGLLEKRRALGDSIRESTACVLTPLPDWSFGYDHTYVTLLDHFKTQSLSGFGCEELRLGVQAAGACIHYLKETQKTDLFHIRSLGTLGSGKEMELDRGTVRSLELIASAGRGGVTLLSIMDRTMTSMGGRLLRSWILGPLLRVEEIRARQEAVREITEERRMRSELREHLKGIYDIERITARIGTGRANPRDLVALGRSAARIPAVRALLQDVASPTLAMLFEKCDPLCDLEDLIGRSLGDEPPILLKEGGIIRDRSPAGW